MDTMTAANRNYWTATRVSAVAGFLEELADDFGSGDLASDPGADGGVASWMGLVAVQFHAMACL